MELVLNVAILTVPLDGTLDAPDGLAAEAFLGLALFIFGPAVFLGGIVPPIFLLSKFKGYNKI